MNIIPRDISIARMRMVMGAVLLVTSFFFSALVAHADAPRVITFTANPSTIHNGYTALFSWTGTGTGYTLIFECPTGVRATSFDGSVSPCGARRSISAGTSVVGYSFTNVSGSRQTVRALLYPKDASGTEYEANKAQVTLSIDPSVQPLTSFTLIPSAVSSGSPVTLNWKSVDVEGVNVQIGCSQHLTWRMGTTTARLTCDVPGLVQDLSPSGSLSLFVTNDSDSPISVPIRLLPAITPGTYDYARTLSATVTVLGKSAAPLPPTPVIVPVATTTKPLVVSTSTSVSTSSTATSPLKFTRTLVRGVRHAEVSMLQSFLATLPGIYSENMITGYYGFLTERAVQRFQEKYDIAHQGDEGFGIVGPKTRAQLNTLNNP